MKTRIAVIPYQLRFRRPLQTGAGIFRQRRGWWILLRDEEGRTGIGEAAPLPGFGTESYAEAKEGIERLGDLFDRAETEGTPPEFDLRLLPALQAGTDLARLDLQGQREGRSVAGLLTPSPRRRVACHHLLRRVDHEEVAAEAAEAVEEGYRTLKIKVGSLPILEDARRLAAVRREVGAAIRLRADANGAYDPITALAALRRFERYDLEFIEQPAAEGLEQIRGRTGVAIAADESASTLRGARHVIESRAADVLILKPMAIGGLRPALGVARRALEEGMQVVVTSILDTPVGVAGALHLAAALPVETACGLATVDLLEETPTRGLGMPAGGSLELPAGAGLGVTLDPSLLEEILR